RLPAAMRVLLKLDYVRDATIFADSLHVLADQGSESQLTDALSRAGFDSPKLTPIPPTLEDVFVTLTRYRKGNHLSHV
ncbi:MAG: hypothetical protein JXR94_17815, partial [Candidatus Hydrogenedentes bacterium]|nr:hypothetical protein [Candidatus Hydrogenedentota bacterium]